jgi:hypothetical protein
MLFYEIMKIVEIVVYENKRLHSTGISHI